ncbi:MAG: hypothetical protein ACREAC_15045, partial [Blastocatellia bacterium]
ADRSAKKWTVDWGDFSGAVAEAVAARKKWHRRNRGKKQRRRAIPVSPLKPRQRPERVFLTTKKRIVDWWRSKEQRHGAMKSN